MLPEIQEKAAEKQPDVQIQVPVNQTCPGNDLQEMFTMLVLRIEVEKPQQHLQGLPELMTNRTELPVQDHMIRLIALLIPGLMTNRTGLLIHQNPTIRLTGLLVQSHMISQKDRLQGIIIVEAAEAIPETITVEVAEAQQEVQAQAVLPAEAAVIVQEAQAAKVLLPLNHQREGTKAKTMNFILV